MTDIYAEARALRVKENEAEGALQEARRRVDEAMREANKRALAEAGFVIGKSIVSVDHLKRFGLFWVVGDVGRGAEGGVFLHEVGDDNRRRRRGKINFAFIADLRPTGRELVE